MTTGGSVPASSMLFVPATKKTTETRVSHGHGARKSKAQRHMLLPSETAINPKGQEHAHNTTRCAVNRLDFSRRQNGNNKLNDNQDPVNKERVRNSKRVFLLFSDSHG